MTKWNNKEIIEFKSWWHFVHNHKAKKKLKEQQDAYWEEKFDEATKQGFKYLKTNIKNK